MTATITNRSVPTATVIPELAYVDVGEVAGWLVMRVEDADAHHERAVAAGAAIVSPPTD